MEETVGAGAHAVGSGAAMVRLRQQIQGLIDADRILPEDGQWLMARLDRSAQCLAAGNLSASRSSVQCVIDRLHHLIRTDLLAAADGEPPVEVARGLLAVMRGEGSRAGNVRSATGWRDRTTGARRAARVGIPAALPPARPEPHAPPEE